MIKPKLPDEPVDGYTIVWYEVYKNDVTAKILKHKAVYHVNTKWSDYAPDRINCLDIVDSWMFYDNDTDTYASGRIGGWKNILQSNWSDDCATYEEAVKLAIDYCEKRIEYFKKEISWAEKCIDTFKGNI